MQSITDFETILHAEEEDALQEIVVAGVQVTEDTLRDATTSFVDMLNATLPSDAELVNIAVRAQDLLECKKALPACASCGVRSLPSDRAEYNEHEVRNLNLLRLSDEQLQEFNGMPVIKQRVKSVFKIQNHAPIGRDDVVRADFLYYHLHPELVTTEEPSAGDGGGGSSRTRRYPRVTCWLCGSCSEAVRDTRSTPHPPPFSLAAGYDYGVLARGLPEDMRAYELSLTETRAISVNR
jgi:hypothetical protein